ncbi:uncharacterized protein LOC142334972 [Convolutriloba macropyga]|uniref:uncharacterized protein LOC142334972 n=1 Tax=Convolutriloba macropyga TaxID=536237 RepID=UPI003F52399C
MGTSTNVIIVILLLVILALVIAVSLVLRFVKEFYKSRSEETNNNNNNSSCSNTQTTTDITSGNRSNRRSFLVRGSLVADDPNLSLINASGVFIIGPTLPRYSACSFNSAPISVGRHNSIQRQHSQILQSLSSALPDASSQHRTNEPRLRSFYMNNSASPPPKYEDLFGVVHISTSPNLTIEMNQSTVINSTSGESRMPLPVVSIEPPPPMSPPMLYSSCLRQQTLLPSYT